MWLLAGLRQFNYPRPMRANPGGVQPKGHDQLFACKIAAGSDLIPASLRGFPPSPIFCWLKNGHQFFIKTYPWAFSHSRHKALLRCCVSIHAADRDLFG